ncbi:MAG: primosomal protein N' [Pseudomonadota bacterium]
MSASPDITQLHLTGRIAVVLPRPLDRAFDYLLPPDQNVVVGQVVTVPFAKGQEGGVVIGRGAGTLPDTALKQVSHIHDFPPLRPAMMSFLNAVAAYTMSPLGLVCRMAFSEKTALDAMVSRRPRSFDAANPDFATMTLEAAQDAAATSLSNAISDQSYSVTVLDGVTGSGKTETYFAAIATALRLGRQVLILLPEIALTSRFLDRFAAHFGTQPATWHSHMTPAQRRQTLRAVAMGECDVVVGARSALFLPFPNLGCIVVDEEHDAAYKQDDGVMYQGRDMAVMRGFHEKIAVILASATPSLETMQNVWTGKYRHVTLPHRYGGATLPHITVVDMRVDKPPSKAEFISQKVRQAVVNACAKNQQSLLFLNRRGYAPLTLCRDCGHRIECPNCSTCLVMHRHGNRLQCHYCGFNAGLPATCPSCQAEGTLAALGPGVERIVEEVKTFLPQARIATLSSDTTMTESDLNAQLSQIYDQDVDVIVGTQIIAKGHHLPALTCVGVIDADMGLQGGDLRAAERSFQLLQQVAGRAGRIAGVTGQVYIQTYQPESRVIQALAKGDRDAFMDAEAASRQAAMMPPMTRLVAIIVSGLDATATAQAARDVAAQLPGDSDYRCLGPAPAPLYRLRRRFRHRLLLQAARGYPCQDKLRQVLANVTLPKGIDLRVDVDPYNFL